VRATLLLILCAIGLVALSALTGSSDAVDPLAIQDELAVSSVAVNGNTIGQTFTFHFPRLHAIEVAWIVPSNLEFQRDAYVNLHLRASPGDATDLASISVPLQQIKNNAYSKFTFSPVANSENQSYYFFVTIPREAITRGVLALWSSSEDTHPDGAMQVKQAPTARDLAFRAYYEPDLKMLAGALASTLARFGESIFFVIAGLGATVWFVTRGSPRHVALALGAASLLAFFVSLEQIRDLATPLWVDSIAHAQFVQYMLEHARLPANNFYHLGFHLLTALTAKISNLSIPESLLLLGQAVWLETGLAAFVLSRRLSAGTLAGLVAAICLWFLSPMPAYFITWGRYPLVLGSAILPLALACAINFIARPNASVQNALLAAITFAALAFSQVRLVAFYAAFLAIYLIVSLRDSRHSQNSARRILILSAVFAALIFSTAFIWLAALFLNGVTLPSIIAENLQQPSIDLQTAIDVAATHHGPELWLLAAVSVVVGIIRRSRATILMLGWLVILTAIALIPPVIGELVPPSMIILMAFLPASILIGDAAQWAYERSGTPRRSVHAAVWVATLASISLIGARDMVSITNPATVLFTPADRRAMQWINANLPGHSTFLINSFNWTGAAYMPSDGGGWIPYFTDDAVAYLDASTLMSDSESRLYDWISARDIRYIYLGIRSGVLHPSDFLSHPERFSMIYNRDGIRIFKFR
jgi:hypothetical protein